MRDNIRAGKVCFDFNREKSRKCFLLFLIKLLANTVLFLLIFLLLFHHNNFLPFCLFSNWREKIAFKSSHFDIITFFFKIQLSFLFFLFFFLIFLLGFCIEQRALPRLVHFRRRNKFRKPNCERGWESFSLRQFQPLGTLSFSFSPLAELKKIMF